MKARPYSSIISRLRKSGLRPTRQRIGLSELLFEGGNKHVTAEGLFSQATERSLKVSLATVYNTLHDFTRVGLLREVGIDSSVRYFDTNVTEHQHLYFEDSDKLLDIDPDENIICKRPSFSGGKVVRRIDVVVRVAG